MSHVDYSMNPGSCSTKGTPYQHFTAEYHLINVCSVVNHHYGGPKVHFLFSAPFVLFSAPFVLFSAPFVLFSAPFVQRRESVLWGHRTSQLGCSRLVILVTLPINLSSLQWPSLVSPLTQKGSIRFTSIASISILSEESMRDQ